MIQDLLANIDTRISINTIPRVTEQLLRTLDTRNLVRTGFILHKNIELDYVLEYRDKHIIVDAKWKNPTHSQVESIAKKQQDKAITLGLKNPKVIIIAKTINNKENHCSKENDFVITTFQTLYNKAIKENKLVI